MSVRERVYLKDHTISGLNREVHVEHFGLGPFFTVQKVEDGVAFLSTRYTTRVKYAVPLESCYFTKRAAKQILREERRKYNV